VHREIWCIESEGIWAKRRLSGYGIGAGVQIEDTSEGVFRCIVVGQKRFISVHFEANFRQEPVYNYAGLLESREGYYTLIWYFSSDKFFE
jgi:hypothetical protein